MAGRMFSAINDDGDAIQSSADTFLKVIAPSNQDILINQVIVAFNGTSATGPQVLVEVFHCDNDGTSSVDADVSKHDQSDGTLRTTAKALHTGEPTVNDIVHRAYIHPQGGHAWSPPRAIRVRQGAAFGVRLTVASGTVNAVVEIVGNE